MLGVMAAWHSGFIAAQLLRHSRDKTEKCRESQSR